jgi:hypothetical protein
MAGLIRRGGPLAVCLVLLGLAALWVDPLDVFDRDAFDRDEVEQAAVSGLMRQGVSASRVTCPGGLEEQIGDRVVCTYVDFLSDTVGTAVLGAAKPPPRKGRVEVRVSEIDHRNFGPRASQSISHPTLSIKVVRAAR